MRYGENPHQSAAFYRDAQPAPGTLAGWHQLQGKELSYNNIADSDAAWECVKTFDVPACVIVKHANPCGVAIGASAAEAYAKAFKTDPTSAFGGIIAFNRTLDGAAAEAVVRQFVEVVIAPVGHARGARHLRRQAERARARSRAARRRGRDERDRLQARRRRRAGAVGRRAQRARRTSCAWSPRRIRPREQMVDLMFAWKVAKFVKSNAIVFCADGMTHGRGRGPDEPHRLARASPASRPTTPA